MSRSFVSNGNIKPCRFVRQDVTSAATEGMVVQSGTGEKIFGVSQSGSRRAPLTGWDDGYCAIATEDVECFTEGDECWLLLGTGGCNQDDQLKSDSDGAGVVTTTANDELGAIALEVGLAGGLCKVRVITRKKL